MQLYQSRTLFFLLLRFFPGHRDDGNCLKRKVFVEQGEEEKKKKSALVNNQPGVGITKPIKNGGQRDDIAAISFFFLSCQTVMFSSWIKAQKKQATKIGVSHLELTIFENESFSFAIFQTLTGVGQYSNTQDDRHLLVVISLARLVFLLDGRTDTVMKSFQGSLKSNRNDFEGISQKKARAPSGVVSSQMGRKDVSQLIERRDDTGWKTEPIGLMNLVLRQ